ncbi:MAG: GTPase HflX [bacterium]
MNSEEKIERAILVGVQLRGVEDIDFAESLAELRELLLSAEGKPVGTLSQRRDRPDSRTYIGKGKVEELGQMVQEKKADSVIFDEKLTPGQVRNLETALDVKVIDRGNLILDIFARRARSRESRTQVELAQLEYLLPRLTRMWSHLTRHAGGIGTRGPGETQLESDRRQIDTRIATLKEKLKKVNKQRETQRKQRMEQAFKIALVGYTNAGKSTLFNQLTRAGVWADNMLFCTLDATTRYLPLADNRRVVISDTVGFIKKLPPELVASFASTLDEVRYADLLLHLVDSSHSHALEHYQRTNRILQEIGAGEVPHLVLFNKCDLLDGEHLPLLDSSLKPNNYYQISAQTGAGVDILLKRLLEFVDTRTGAVNRSSQEEVDGQGHSPDS